MQTASLVAADLLTAEDKDDDGIPLLKPVSCGREGQAPVIIKLPALQGEAFAIADHLASAHKESFAWHSLPDWPRCPNLYLVSANKTYRTAAEMRLAFQECQTPRRDTEKRYLYTKANLFPQKS